jgi:hypothetical protein
MRAMVLAVLVLLTACAHTNGGTMSTEDAQAVAITVSDVIMEVLLGIFAH